MASPRLNRRAALALGLGGLAGCAMRTPGELPPAEGVALPPPVGLRLVIFEINALEVPFHTGLILRTPERMAIYDPAGFSDPGHGAIRDGDMIRNVSDAVEAEYLARADIHYAPGGWTAHVFDRPLTDNVARLALARAEAAPEVLPLHCAWGVTTVLEGLPGFGFIEPSRITPHLLRTMLLRRDFTYSRFERAATQPG